MSCWRKLAALPRRLAVIAIFLVVLSLQIGLPSSYSGWADIQVRLGQKTGQNAPVDKNLFESLPVSGFVNTRIPYGTNCSDVRLDGQALAITKSIYLADDVLGVARKAVHPTIDYSWLPKDLTYEEKVQRTWARMGGSSVWLEKWRVYFVVSRIFFYTRGKINLPKVSFIRAQVYDEHWNHLEGYSLQWRGRNVTFPKTLDIEAPYWPGRGFYGPEDPRLIVEQDVADGEPVIIFNLLERRKKPVRTMHIHRPFSNFTTYLHIEDKEPVKAEKNWSPFFMPRTDKAAESEYIYFVYNYHPLKILRCHLVSGLCKLVYAQDQAPETYRSYIGAHNHSDVGGAMHGGTNFVPVRFESRAGLTSFIGFPRTKTSAGCGREAFYRPVMMLLATNGTHFFMEYASEALGFGNALLTQPQLDDPCETGRILLVNSIARFDDQSDLMTMSFTVADSTVQVATVHGVRHLIESLPQLRSHQKASWHEEDLQWKLNVTHDIVMCSTRTASEFALAHTLELATTKGG